MKLHNVAKNFEQIYLKGRFLGGDAPCIADLIAFYDITMLEVLDYDYSKNPKIVKWIGEMRKIKEVQQADAKFHENKEGIKMLLKQH